MATSSGVSAQFGFAAETTYGTGVTPARFLEFLDEGLAPHKYPKQGMGLRAGSMLPIAARRYVPTADAGGDVNLLVPSKGFGLLLKHMLGATTIVQQGATAAWLQTFTVADLAGLSLTVQKGVPDLSGTVQPWTFVGTKIPHWELSCAQADFLKAKVGFDAKDWDQGSTALATASFPAAFNLFHFAEGVVQVGGSNLANVRDFTLTCDNGIKADRYNFNNGGRKAEQLMNNFRKITGKMTVEFTSPAALYAAYAADTTLALTMNFTGPNIASTFYETFGISLPAVKLEGDTPNVKGPDLPVLDVGFTVLDPLGGTSPVTITYMSTDTAA